MTEEVPKRSRSSYMDRKYALNFSDPTSFHDRVLAVEGKKFYVTSSHLCQYSEFFNGLFNANFKEKDQEEIELNEIKAEDFEYFLYSLQPFPFRTTKYNLRGLMTLSCQFLCPFVWNKCMKYLKNERAFSSFEIKDLLEWSKGSDSVEFKERLENVLIVKHTARYREHVHIFGEHLELAVSYELKNLKKFILDNLKLKEQPERNYYEDFLKIALKLDVFELKLQIEEILLDNLNAHPYSLHTISLIFIDTFMDNLTTLKENVEKRLSNDVELITDRKERRFLSAIFRSNRYKEPKKVAEKLLVNILEKKDPENFVDYLDVCKKFDLQALRTKAEELMTKWFDREPNKEKFVEDCLQVAAEYNLKGFKDSIENHLIEIRNGRSASNIVDLLQYVNRFKLDKLSANIDDWLVGIYKANKVPRELSYCLDAVHQCDLKNLKAELVSRVNELLQQFSKTGVFSDLCKVDAQDLIFFKECSSKAKLQSKMDSFLGYTFINEADKSHERVVLYLKLAKKYHLWSLKLDIAEFTESEFTKRKCFNYIQQAFDYNLQGFKKLLGRYLRNCNVQALSLENRRYLFNASPEVNKFVIKHLLRLENEEP